MILSGGYWKDHNGEWQRFWAPEVGESETPQEMLFPPAWHRFTDPPPEVPELPPTEESIMSTMRAKFRVTGINRQEYGVGLNMEPVQGTYKDGKYVPQAENSRFWSASPSGKFEMWVNKDRPAFDLICGMAIGAEFYLDFTPAVVVDETKAAAS